jgi:thiamine-phosphate pyrophosphorylase
MFYKLMLVTNKGVKDEKEYLSFIENCAKAGITSVQLREKELHGEELISFGLHLKSILKFHGVPLIVNDSLELTQILDAEGVHLGQKDGSAMAARQVLGNKKIIGISIDTLEQLKAANDLPLNYVGIGSIFPTNSKKNVQTFWGLEKLKEATSLSKHPVIAIGGINADNITKVINAGADGIAAIEAFHQKDGSMATQRLRHLLDLTLEVKGKI